MRKLLAGIAFAAGLINPLTAQQRATIDASLRATDKYLAQRGFVPTGHFTLQPQATLSVPAGKGVVKTSYWGTLQDFPEHDLGFAYAWPILETENRGKLEGMVGWQSYKDNFDFYQEIQAEAKLLNPKLLNPRLFMAHDYSKAGHGQYFEPSLGATTPKLPFVHAPIDVMVAGMYNNHYIYDSSRWTGCKVGAEMAVKQFKDGTKITIDGLYFRSVDPQFKSRWTGGVNIKFRSLHLR